MMFNETILSLMIPMGLCVLVKNYAVLSIVYCMIDQQISWLVS